MAEPSGQRYELLDPFDPRQEPGRPARRYPLHLMEVGDWFPIELCTPLQANALRASITNYRKHAGNAIKRFSVRRWPAMGPAAVVCVRVA